MMPPYTPQDWYWAVAGSTTQVWSSRARAYVPVDDAAYLAWLAAGHVPTPIASEADLWDVLATQYPAGLPVGNTTLRDRLRQQAQAMLDASNDRVELALRALALLTLDEVNRHAQWQNALKANVAAAPASVAGIRGAIAALPAAPTYTAQQLVAAMKQKIADGLAD